MINRSFRVSRSVSLSRTRSLTAFLPLALSLYLQVKNSKSCGNHKESRATRSKSRRIHKGKPLSREVGISHSSFIERGICTHTQRTNTVNIGDFLANSYTASELPNKLLHSIPPKGNTLILPPYPVHPNPITVPKLIRTHQSSLHPTQHLTSLPPTNPIQ